ncbi:MAG: PAS domain S-box protein, partial [Microcoleus sp.]
MKIPNISKSVAKTIGKLPLRTVLIVPFVLQIAGMVGFVGYLSYKNGEESIENIAHQLMAQVGERVNDRLTKYLEAPQHIAATNARSVKQGNLNYNDLKQVRRELWKQITLNYLPQSIFFANELGELIGYGHLQSEEIVRQAEQLTGEQLSVGTPHLLKIESSEPGKRKYYLVDAKGNPRKLIYTAQIDNRTTAWYRDSKVSRQQIWSSISVYKVIPTLGIFGLAPIYDASGKWQGVFVSDFTLSGISTFLEQLKFSRSGQVFIMEHSGNLVASSTLETPFVKPATGEPTRLLAANSKDTLTRDIARQLTKRFGNLDAIQTNQKLTLTSNGEQQFVRVTHYRDNYGLDWLVVVVVPASDFMEQIYANTRTTILLCIAALVGSTTVGIITARWITQPILKLNKAAKDIAEGKWEITVAIDRADEVGEMAKSFNRMAAQLQQSFGELESLNEALMQSENKVNQILEAIPVGVAVHDRTGRVIYLNQIARELLGIETLLQAETGQLAATYCIYQAETEELYPEANLPIVRSLKGERVRADDLEVHSIDRVFPAEIYSTPLFDDKGEILGTLAAFFDITDRKQSEKIIAEYNRTLEAQVARRTAELTRTNEHLQSEIAERKLLEAMLETSTRQVRTIFESITDIVLIIDAKRNLQVIPTKGINWSGTNANSIDLIVKQFFQDDTEEVWFAKVRQALATEQTVDFEYSWRINNRDVWWSAKISPLPDRSVVWVARDITEMKQAEQALRESEQRYLAIIEDQTELIIRFLPSGIATFVNEAFCRYFGLTREEIIGHRFEPLIVAEDRDRVNQIINSISLENPVIAIENRVMISGEVRWTQWISRGIFDDR